MHPKIRVSILIVVLLVTSLVLISCGAFEDDNSQPAIGPITDQTGRGLVHRPTLMMLHRLPSSVVGLLKMITVNQQLDP